MLPRLKCPVIALEEHYWDKELAAQFVGGEGVRDPDMLKRLHDLGEVQVGVRRQALAGPHGRVHDRALLEQAAGDVGAQRARGAGDHDVAAGEGRVGRAHALRAFTIARTSSSGIGASPSSHRTARAAPRERR